MQRRGASLSRGAAWRGFPLRAPQRAGLVGALLALWVLLPKMAGPAYELKVPVLYAQVRLAQQAPIVLDLDLPPAEYTISPVSLGYFTSSRKFVYTATVARGIIYGSAADGPVVIEVVALPEAEQYVENHLAVIREQVAQLNQCQNELKLKRQAWPPAVTAAEREADQLWQVLAPAPGQPGSTRWPADCPQAGDPTYLAALTSRLLAQAAQASELKQLYFASQATRINLLLHQYDLQLALARLPKPEIAGLLCLGDERVVQTSCLTEISRLEQAWRSRREGLSRLLDTDQAWAKRLLDRSGALPASPEMSLPGLPNLTEGSLAAAPADPRTEAEKALVAARLVAEQTELKELANVLALLQTAKRQVEQSLKIDSTELPSQRVEPARLSLAGCENTPGYAAVIASATEWVSAQELLLTLARSFETADRGRAMAGGKPQSPLPDLDLNEISLGLLLLDQLADVAGAAGAEEASLTPPTAASKGDTATACLPLSAHLELIETVLREPDAYGVASYELGFLRFARWYGQLLLK